MDIIPKVWYILLISAVIASEDNEGETFIQIKKKKNNVEIT